MIYSQHDVITLSKRLYIPSYKPTLETICDSTLIPSLESFHTLCTTSGLSYENKRMSGTTLHCLIKFKGSVIYQSCKNASTSYALYYQFYNSVYLTAKDDISYLLDTHKLRILPTIETYTIFKENCTTLTFSIIMHLKYASY